VTRLLLALLSFAILSRAEAPAKVSLCDLKKDRARYNHKLIEVTGFVSHGFENFTLFDPSCTGPLDLWLEYGGKQASGTMYCCGVTNARTRPTAAVIEGIGIPLVDDDAFRRFDKLVQSQPATVVHATLVGRLFVGEKVQLSGEVLWRGYGHMGCCLLFAIQQVRSVDPLGHPDLDIRDWTEWPTWSGSSCSGGENYIFRPKVLDIQRQFDREAIKWGATDPKRVAVEALAKNFNVETREITGIRETRSASGRRQYEWRSGADRFLIEVSRPYWLSYYANDPKRVVWVAIGAWKCGPK
jgi:hypothetical protein